MVIFVTYSNDLYAETRDYSAKMALKKGKVDKVIIYKPEDIDEDFYKKNERILSLKAGNGLWLWKPYFIYKALTDASDGDIVLYCDAGSFFYKKAKSIIDSMDDDIWVSDIPLVEKQFTKPELAEYMDCNAPVFLETNQIQANFIAIRKNKRGLQFAKEWLNICEYGDNLTRETKYNSETPDFIFLGHRSDQSVLSLLVKKWGIKPHLDPTQFGRVPEKYYSDNRIFIIPNHEKEYKSSIILHRTKDVDKRIVFNQWLITWMPKFIIPFFSKSVRIAIRRIN